MKIVLASALFPPDTAEVALYIKELGRRLAPEHQVTLVVYGRYPELVPGVEVYAVRKDTPLLYRMVVYFFTLLKAVRGADVLFVENGASVELPATLVARLANKPLFLHLGDTSAKSDGIRKRITRFAGERAQVLEDISPSKPEILPFGPRPTEALEVYAQWWNSHLQKLEALFHG